MLLPGHVGGSYLVAAASSRARTTAFALFTLGAGLATDIDVVPVLLRAGWQTLGMDRAGEHRASILHTPLFAVAVGLITLAVRRRDRWQWAVAGFAAVLVHLVLDSLTIGPGVMWLYPWTETLYGLNLANNYFGRNWGDDWLRQYLTHPLFLIEIGLLAASPLEA
jgi:membrane-bound metal-dependent hydrolase YbcI (DUF457 family)